MLNRRLTRPWATRRTWLKALKGLEALPESEYKDALRALADTVLARDR